MQRPTDLRRAITRLADEDPDWLPAVRAALAVSDRMGNRFPGAAILEELRRGGGSRTWYPNFRRLVTWGILERLGAAPGRTALYGVVDAEGVRQGLADVDSGGREVYPPLSFAGVGHSGRSDLSSRIDELLESEFPEL